MLLRVACLTLLLTTGCNTPEPVAPKPCPKLECKQDTTAPPQATQAPDSGPLVLQGTPDIPRELIEKLESYTGGRSAAARSITSDGKRMIIGTRFGRTTQLHLLTKPGGARQQITFLQEPVGGGGFVPGQPNKIVYVSDTGGTEKHQIYIRDLQTGETTRLTDGKSRNGGPAYSNKGDKFVFSSNRRTGKVFDLWLSDGKSADAAKLLLETDGWWYPLNWSPDDKKLLVGKYISINESHVYEVDVATGSKRRVTEPGKVSYQAARYARRGKGMYFLSDKAGEFVQLYEVSADGKNWRNLTAKIPWNIDGFSMSDNGRRIVFVTNEDGYNRAYLLDTRSRKYKRLPLPAGLISGMSFPRKQNNLLKLTISGPTSNGDAYTFDLRTNKLTRWTESELAGVQASSFVAPKQIKFKSFDGREIPAHYYRPRGAGPFPVIINIHGGPEAQSRPHFSSLTQYFLNESKVAVIYPNVRGSRGYGKTYLQLDNGFKREDSVKDIGALLDWIGKQKELDSKRVGVMGGSYGGYMVLASLVHYSDRIVAGVDVVGISNFVTFLKNTADYRRDLRRAEYGDERDPKMAAHQQKISPLTNVDKINSALFVAQGANDPRVPASEAEQIVKAVKAKGKDVWYMLAKNEGHGFRKKENRDKFLQLTVLFFEKHLQVAAK